MTDNEPVTSGVRTVAPKEKALLLVKVTPVVSRLPTRVREDPRRSVVETLLRVYSALPPGASWPVCSTINDAMVTEVGMLLLAKVMLAGPLVVMVNLV
jgi:hypothetical protein